MEHNRIWVTPSNDLESKTIIEILKRNGEDFLVTAQPWGASWQKLEEEIKKKIEQCIAEGKQVYGVELKGYVDGTSNIDHHVYDNDDRSNTKSSIEQVAEILGVELTVDEKFVAVNDKGFIPAMEKLGVEINLRGEELQKIIRDIRMRDRLAQGITLEQEAASQEEVEKLGEITEKQELILMDLPHSKFATVTDRLYGKYENLLITSANGVTIFFGKTNLINSLKKKFPKCWYGGQLGQGSGYWGLAIEQDKEKLPEENEKIKKETQEQIKQLVQAEIEKTRNTDIEI